ncbi:hypothetical protein BOX15_Mlig028694g1 [Macrostomum lignano]|uniref:Uncharacterized protein n=1 Tax=Macrostomum lignano TaxID=282301 RepID=A0A267E9S5_9PLAT|nr:hypothetical protein BOX15_Mlig028694g1 [Macrostomum lignano]
MVRYGTAFAMAVIAVVCFLTVEAHESKRRYNYLRDAMLSKRGYEYLHKAMREI